MDAIVVSRGNDTARWRTASLRRRMILFFSFFDDPEENNSHKKNSKVKIHTCTLHAGDNKRGLCDMSSPEDSRIVTSSKFPTNYVTADESNSFKNIRQQDGSIGPQCAADETSMPIAASFMQYTPLVIHELHSGNQSPVDMSCNAGSTNRQQQRPRDNIIGDTWHMEGNIYNPYNREINSVDPTGNEVLVDGQRDDNQEQEHEHAQEPELQEQENDIDAEIEVSERIPDQNETDRQEFIQEDSNEVDDAKVNKSSEIVTGISRNNSSKQEFERGFPKTVHEDEKAPPYIVPFTPHPNLFKNKKRVIVQKKSNGKVEPVVQANQSMSDISNHSSNSSYNVEMGGPYQNDVEESVSLDQRVATNAVSLDKIKTKDTFNQDQNEVKETMSGVQNEGTSFDQSEVTVSAKWYQSDIKLAKSLDQEETVIECSGEVRETTESAYQEQSEISESVSRDRSDVTEVASRIQSEVTESVSREYIGASEESDYGIIEDDGSEGTLGHISIIESSDSSERLILPKINTSGPVQLTGGVLLSDSYSPRENDRKSWSLIEKANDVAKRLRQQQQMQQQQLQYQYQQQLQQHCDILKIEHPPAEQVRPLPRMIKPGIPIPLRADALLCRDGKLEISVTDTRNLLPEYGNVNVNITFVHKHKVLAKVTNQVHKKKKVKVPPKNTKKICTDRDILKHRAMHPPFNTHVDEEASKRHIQFYGLK